MTEHTTAVLPYATLADGADDLARIGAAHEAATTEGVGLIVVRNSTNGLVTVYPDSRVTAGHVRNLTTQEWIGTP